MLTASIVAYHTPDEEIVRAAQLAEHSAIDRLYVVDNSSSGSTAALLRDCRKVKYIASDNRGFGASHNRAIRQAGFAGSTFHIVMNADVTVSPGDISVMKEYLKTHSDVVALQPRIVNADGSDQFTVRLLPTPLDSFGRRFLPSRLMARRNNRYLLKCLDHDAIFEAPYHQGSFMFLRMEKLLECGAFDERFFMYPEDIDLTRRLHRLGKTIYFPHVKVTHLHNAASYHSLKMLAVHCVNMVRYFNKWGWLNDKERRKFNAQTLRQSL